MTKIKILECKEPIWNQLKFKDQKYTLVKIILEFRINYYVIISLLYCVYIHFYEEKYITTI